MRSFLLAVLAAAVAAPACAADESADRAKADPVRVACVGDSITFGSGVEDREKNCYPAVLGRLLGAGYEVRNFGVSGATLQKRGDKPYWTEKAFTAVAEFRPDVVVVKLGTNDSKPQNWHGADLYEPDLVSLVTTFRNLPGKPQVFLATPAPVVRENFGIRPAVVRDEIVPVVKEVAKRNDLPLVDLHAALSGHDDWFPDGVHPNAAGAKQIAETVAEAIKSHPAKPAAE